MYVILTQLNEHGRKIIKLPQLEQLKDTEPVLYAIRIKGSLNFRVIFCIEDDIIILLVVFKEKSKSDYKRAINQAYSRYKTLEED